MIRALVSAGFRVGVTANSHKVVISKPIEPAVAPLVITAPADPVVASTIPDLFLGRNAW